MHDRALVEALSSSLRPREIISLPDWMDRNIVLERGGHLVPWETKRTPYLFEIGNDLSVDSPVEEIAVQKPSQTGLSEFAIGFHCYMADVAPCNMIMIQPDLEAAARFKQLRIDPVIKNSPRLRSIFAEKKSRDAGNSQHLLTFPGGAWLILGANSPAGVSSLPSPIDTIDELDRAAASVGVGVRAEGDLYLLIRARTITFRESFPRRKLLRISSPGEKSTSKIEPAWLASDRRRYHVPCNECGAFVPHLMSRLWWPRNGDPRTARYRCQVCDKLRDERLKDEMLQGGRWVAEREHEVHGYKLVGCDSPFLRWGEMAADRERVKGNPNELRVYVNTIEGETYDSTAEAKVDVASLKLLATPIEFVDGKPVVPRGAGLLTAGTDTQPNRLETTLKAWGAREEQWQLDHVIFPGDASSRHVWDDLDTYAQTLWPTWCGMSMGLKAMCVDTAGANTIPAYNFVRGKGHRRIYGTVGRSGQGKPLWSRKPRQSRNIGKVDLFTVGIDGAKTQLYARLKASIEQVRRGEPPGGPGFVHIAAHLCEDVVKPDGSREPSEYLQQLVAEYVETTMTKAGPKLKWVLPAHMRNEALDCDVLAQAALGSLKAVRKNLERYVARFNPETATAIKLSPSPRSNGIFDPKSESPVWVKNPPSSLQTRPEERSSSASIGSTPKLRKRTRPRREIAE